MAFLYGLLECAWRAFSKNLPESRACLSIGECVLDVEVVSSVIDSVFTADDMFSTILYAGLLFSNFPRFAALLVAYGVPLTHIHRKLKVQ